MARTITNFADLSDPLTESIDAQTEFFQQQAAEYQGAITSVYNTPLNCGATTPSADELITQQPVCCREETLEDTPEAGDVTKRVTCSDGSITDTITYASDGVTCTVNVKSANPTPSGVSYDENCQLQVTDAIETACKARVVGEPYPEYFIPRTSDFGNQIYCVPGSTYAFAWSGVMNNNIKSFLQENAGEIDLDDPTNKYVAIVGGQPVGCGSNNADNTYTTVSTEPAGQDGNGDDYYCYYNGDGFAHTEPDLLLHTAANIAFDNMGDPIPCSFSQSDLQGTQALKLDGCYSLIASVCPAWSGEEEPISTGGTDEDGGFNIGDFLGNLPDLLNKDVNVPDLDGKTSQEAYFCLWKDYWACEKRAKCMQQYLYWAQLPLAIAGLITSINTYNEILDKDLDILCDVQEDVARVNACSADLLGTAEEPGILKQCQDNLLAGHADRLGTVNNRGTHACQLACNELDAYDQLWKPIQQKNVSRMGSHLHTMIENGKLTSEYAQNWAEGLDDTVVNSMLPELRRQFTPLMNSMNETTTNLNQWRDDLRSRSQRLSNHVQQTYIEPEARLMPQIMKMSECAVSRVCELRDHLFDWARCDKQSFERGYQQGEIRHAQASLTTSAQLIPKLVESVSWLDTNIPYISNIFETCFGQGQSRLNPQLWDNASSLAPEVVRCFDWFQENAKVDREFFDKVFREGEEKLVKAQLELACDLTSRVEDSLFRLDSWSIQDRHMFDKKFRSQEIAATKATAKNGRRATDELHEFGHWMEEQSKHFHDIYHTNYLPCDLEFLKEQWAVWDRSNPLQGIERNNEDLNRLANQLQGVTETGLQRFPEFIKEGMASRSEFDYCVESSAYLHVRAQVSRGVEELKRCLSPYATGHLLDAISEAKIRGARAEGAAMEAATRWKWWANEQQSTRTFNQRLEIMKLLDAYALRTLDASKTETAGQDILLNHMAQTLVRGQSYLNFSREASQATASIKTGEVDSMLRTVQLWHFWPELAQQGNIAFNNGVFEVQNDAQQLLQLGRFWPELASRQKGAAVDIVDSSVDVGMRMSQLGQFYAQQAESLNAQRTSAVQTAAAIGSQAVQQGHSLHRLSNDQTNSALSNSIAGGSMGIQAGQLGAQQISTALEIENRMTLNALEHLKAGIGAFGIGIDFLQEVRQSYNLSGSYGIPASGQMLGLFEAGQKSAGLGLLANEQCYDMNYQILCKAKDYVQRNFEVTQNSLHGGTSGTLNAANNLLSQQGDNVGGAFGLLGNSLQGIFSNNSTPPMPTGISAFGSPGIGGGSFGGF